MEIDIAVDLKGYTQNHRSGIFAHRPAPIQVSYLGYPGTMGASYIDYIIADHVVIPDEHLAFYTERIAYLPDTYQCNDFRRPIADRPGTRTEAGLPETGFVFCCFNNNFKIAPGMFELWMRLLHAVPGSILWLLDDNADATRNLRSQSRSARNTAGACSSSHRAWPWRSILHASVLPISSSTRSPMGRTPPQAMRYGRGCRFLPFSARVSRPASPPVCCMRPDCPSSSPICNPTRRSRCIWHAISAALAALKTKLAANCVTRPLFDTETFTHNLEAAYIAMWQLSKRGEPPRNFSLAERQVPWESREALAIYPKRPRRFFKRVAA